MIKVYGISEETKQLLQQISISKYGKSNISFLIKQLIKEELSKNNISPKPKNQLKKNKQLRIRLNHQELEKLKNQSTQYLQSPNTFASDLLSHYLTKNKPLSTAEIEVLHQSNYQLLRIGRNINQIAKTMNALEGESLSSNILKEIQNMISTHTEKVGNLLLENRKRFENV